MFLENAATSTKAMSPDNKGGGALMNLIMNLADLGKSENNEFVENEKI